MQALAIHFVNMSNPPLLDSFNALSLLTPPSHLQQLLNSFYHATPKSPSLQPLPNLPHHPLHPRLPHTPLRLAQSPRIIIHLLRRHRHVLPQSQ